MFSMPIVSLLDEARRLAERGQRVSVLWQQTESLVFIARGREYRSEFHINPSDKTMYMIKGEMHLHYRAPEGKEEIAVIREGSLIYTPAGVPHSPRFQTRRFCADLGAKEARRRNRSFSLVLPQL
jgi:3-hydroxyanthranilate 3,4-dioxygenase